MQSSAGLPLKIIVTGEHEDLDSKFPSELGFQGTPLEWISLPVLQFQRLSVDLDWVREIADKPFDWLLISIFMDIFRSQDLGGGPPSG